MSTPREEFLQGLREILPILLGVAPFGLIYGALAVGAGLPVAAAQAMSSVVFAGSSQFIATQLFGAGTAGWVIVMVIAVVNLRHGLYSASLAPYLNHLSRGWKAGLAYLLTDEAYAVAINHYQRVGPGPARHFYLLGAGLTLWASWQLSTAVGIFIGAQLPADWPVGFILPLTFIAIVVPNLKDRAAVAAALAAAAVGLAGAGLPYKTGLMLGALAGILAGMGVEWKRR